METITKEITNSSQVTKVGYNEETKILTITFKTGKSYEYYDVPKDIFDSMLTAESIGKYLNQFVKPFYKYKAL